MKRPLTLADARAEGRDPLSLLGADRALLLDSGWLARAQGGAPLLFWDDEDDAEESAERLPYELLDGVAVLDVEGPIAQRGWYCIDGYDTIAANLERALHDTRVRSVLLRLNSPGGAAAGAFEWTRMMREAVVSSRKRVVAYSDEMAFSGAYAVACVADEIVLPETGEVGSVGVIASMVSRARMNDSLGIDVRVIHAGAEKADGCPNLPLDPDAIARAQRDVDALAGVFHRWVSERRGMSAQAVAALEAGTRMGPEAVTSGLADRVLGYHALLAEMRADAAAQTTPPTGRVPIFSVTRNTSTRHPMNEETLAAVAALTGESDPSTAVSSLIAKHAAVSDQCAKLGADLAAAQSTISGLSADLANERTRAAEMSARVEKIERDAEITAAKASGQWSPSLEPFLGSLSIEQLRTWRASAPPVVPLGEVKPPAEEARADRQLPVDLANTIAKASKDGWGALSAKEKHAVSAHDKDLAARLRAR